MMHGNDESFDPLTGAEKLTLRHDDGFRTPDDFPDAPYVTWDVDGGSNSQNIHYLHGGLHLYDAGFEFQKFCWERAGMTPLMDQISEALDQERYPIFVSEGDSSTKLDKILHNGYLTRSYKSLAGVCHSPKSVLFMYGVSLSDNDSHILKLIETGSIRNVFIGIYGDPLNHNNQLLIARANQLTDSRERGDLQIDYYHAESARVWG